MVGVRARSRRVRVLDGGKLRLAAPPKVVAIRGRGTSASSRAVVQSLLGGSRTPLRKPAPAIHAAGGRRFKSAADACRATPIKDAVLLGGETRSPISTQIGRLHSADPEQDSPGIARQPGMINRASPLLRASVSHAIAVTCLGAIAGSSSSAEAVRHSTTLLDEPAVAPRKAPAIA